MALRRGGLAGVCLALLLVTTTARAEDKLSVAIGQMDAWVNQAAVLGQKAGIFQKYGIVLDNVATQGSGETIQAVVSNAAQVGIGVGTLGAMRAFAQGAPIRIVAASFTGVGDLYWYVPANSPIKTLSDATADNTIAFSSNGSSVQAVVLAFGQQLGLKAKPVQTGGLSATFTQAMSHQIDIGWATPPFGLREESEGKIRIIANGNDVPSLRNETVRVEIMNDSVAKNQDLLRRFMRAYRESLDYLFNTPQATKAYAEQVGVPENIVSASVDKFHLKAGKQPDRISDVDAIMQDGVKYKILDKPLTKDQLSELIQILPPGS